MTRKKLLIYSLLLVLIGCGKVKEQRFDSQRLTEGLKDQEVKRVTDDQIYTAAYNEGLSIVSALEGKSDNLAYWQGENGQDFLDSLSTALNHGGIKLITESTGESMNAEEKALFEAYQYSNARGDPVKENVQSLQGEYLLFNSPLIPEDEFVGMWSILLSKKTLIRNLP